MTLNRPHWSSQAKLVTSLLLLALAIYLFSQFSVVFAPLILAVILAYILSPMVNFFQRRLKLRRGFAALLAYLILLVSLVVVLMLLIPPLANQLSGLTVDIQRLLTQVDTLLLGQYTFAGQTINLEALFQQMVGSVQVLLEPVFGQTLGFALEVITSLVWIVFILVVSFYFIKDSQSLREWIEHLVPPSYKNDFVRLRTAIGEIWSSFFRGQLILASVVTTIFTIVGFILGLPFALAMGVLAGLMEFLPSLGHGIWLLIASLLALFVGSSWIPLPNWAFMLIVIGLHLIYQQFDLNYLIPRIIGRSVHLPPLVVILGIVAGAALAGVLGIFLAAPTIASARVLGRYLYANLIDMDPFPSEATRPLPPPDPDWWRKITPSRQAEVRKD